jgi:hypothetical protein
MAEPAVEGGSVQEIEKLYAVRYRRFLRLALAVVGSPEPAADAVQEAFAQARCGSGTSCGPATRSRRGLADGVERSDRPPAAGRT